MLGSKANYGNLARISAQVSSGSVIASRLGATSALAMVTEAADTIEYDRVDLTASGKKGFDFDLNGDDANDFFVGANEKICGIKVLGGGTGKIAGTLFDRGDSIDDAAVFNVAQNVYGGSPTLGLGVGKTRYLGLRLGDSQNGYNYGWVEFTRGSLTAGRIGCQTVSGVEAPIPPVPVPASLPLLALGVGGLVALRRQLKAA